MDCKLVSYCCETNCPKALLKATVSESEKSKSSLTGSSVSGSLMRLQSGCSLGICSFESGHGRSIWEITWLLARGFSSSSYGPLHMAAYNMASLRVSVERQWEQTCKWAPKMEAADFYNLISEVTYHCFCCSLFVTQTNPWTIIQGCKFQKAGIIGGPSWTLAPTVWKPSNMLKFMSSQ